MGRTPLSNTEEYTSFCPAGRFKVKFQDPDGLEATRSKPPGKKKMYVARMIVVEPKQVKGRRLTDWWLIGTDDDPKALNDETWQRSDGGPGKLVKAAKKCGVKLTDEEEEWLPNFDGAECCVSVRVEETDRGPMSRVVDYFRETDDDFAGVGLDDAGNGKVKAKRKARPADDDDDDDDRKKKMKPADDDDDDDDDGKKKPVDEDDDDDDDDDEPKSRRAKKRK